MTTVSTKHVGPYVLTRLPTLGKVYITVREDGEGGRMPLREFEKEVCPWDDLGEGMEERVRRFYAEHF